MEEEPLKNKSTDLIKLLPTEEEIEEQKYVGRSPAHCEEWEGFKLGVKWIVEFMKNRCE